MNWLNCYNTNGTFITELAFTEMFNSLPQKESYINRDIDIDMSLITEEMLKSIIPNVQLINKQHTVSASTTSEEDSYETYEQDGKVEYFIKDGSSFFRVFCNDNKIFSIDQNCITCYCLDNTAGSDLCKLLWDKLPKMKEEPKEATVKLICYSQGDYYTMDSKIKKIDINIEENYNDDFIPVYKDICDFLDQRESGLILLHGKVGTGKTNFIRFLCSSRPKDYIVVPTSMASRLSDPDFISFMIDHRDSIFVLEDCEQLLMDRSENMFNGAISNILNMSDGLLSDIMNIKFICTFNADIEKIDSALLRKGRCYAKYEFKELTEDKVENLNKKHDLRIEKIKPMTLAEIYNSEKTEYSEIKKRKKIGF